LSSLRQTNRRSKRRKSIKDRRKMTKMAKIAKIKIKIKRMIKNKLMRDRRQI